MNPLLIGLVALVGFVLLKKPSSATASKSNNVFDNSFVSPGFNTGGNPTITLPKNATTLAAGMIGKTLTAMTGIPGFDQVGQTLSELFGKGRREADQLVQTYQNPTGALLGRISDGWVAALQSGRATAEAAEIAKQLVRKAQVDFVDVAQNYNLAGPGGIATINAVCETMIRSINNDIVAYGLN